MYSKYLLNIPVNIVSLLCHSVTGEAARADTKTANSFIAEFKKMVTGPTLPNRCLLLTIRHTNTVEKWCFKMAGRC